MHGLFKKVVPHTNKKNIDLDLLRHYNTLQALRFWLDGGRDKRIQNLEQSNHHYLPKRLLSGWYITELDNPINDSNLVNNESEGNFYFFQSISINLTNIYMIIKI